MTTTERMSREEGELFFSDFYCGKHHFPSKLREWGWGFSMNHYGDLSTTDFDGLTRLVLMAHDRCVRVELIACNMQYTRIAISRRDPKSTSIMEGHPTIERSLAAWREHHPERTADQ